jgi:hypothetical protein
VKVRRAANPHPFPHLHTHSCTFAHLRTPSGVRSEAKVPEECRQNLLIRVPSQLPKRVPSKPSQKSAVTASQKSAVTAFPKKSAVTAFPKEYRHSLPKKSAFTTHPTNNASRHIPKNVPVGPHLNYAIQVNPTLQYQTNFQRPRQQPCHYDIHQTECLTNLPQIDPQHAAERGSAVSSRLVMTGSDCRTVIITDYCDPGPQFDMADRTEPRKQVTPRPGAIQGRQ